MFASSSNVQNVSCEFWPHRYWSHMALILAFGAPTSSQQNQGTLGNIQGTLSSRLLVLRSNHPLTIFNLISSH